MKNTKFSRFPLKEFIINAVLELKFFEPTEIQERIMPAILNGESVIGQSQTGTGKTHAFLLPILNKIDPTKENVQAIITAPTRELAQQIYDETKKIIKHCKEDEEISVKLLMGGTDRTRTIEKLKKQPHVVIGTPGRILDMVEEQALNVYNGTVMVIDEADLTLDLGFIKEIDLIASRMAEKLQILVFSATIPEKLKPFLNKYMENPRFTHVAPKQVSVKKLDHTLIPLRSRNKIDLFMDIANAINPYLALVFLNTREEADRVADQLIEKGLSVGRIHGDLNPRERKKMMKQIKNLDFQYVVATDLAARGIDIAGVSHVINLEIPSDLEFYIHRTGRTARANQEGTAITVYQPSDEDKLIRLEQMGITFKHVDLKDNEWIELDHRNKRKLRKKQENEDVVQAKRMVRKPSKVKPGYKKKRQEEINKIVRKKKRNKRS